MSAKRKTGQTQSETEESMRNLSEREFTTYPRKFNAYRWFKPILVGLLFIVFYFLFASLVFLITSLVFRTTVTSTGYDDLNFYSASGAFFNSAIEAVYIPSFLIAGMIVKDRPFSSYFSSMGGWRWKTFLRTFAAGFVILGIPLILFFLLNGRVGEVQFTPSGLILLILLMPLLCVAEELMYRGYVTQTVSSWFKLPLIGLFVQTAAFAAAHPYNLTGVIYIAATAVIYGLISVYSKGIETSSALHIVNNLTELIMGGFGFGVLTSQQTVSSSLFNVVFKIAFLAFILYADKKLHWFNEVQYDDIESFNTRHPSKKRAS